MNTDRYDEARIAKTRKWPIDRAAVTLDNRVREIAGAHGEDFTELGLIVQEVRDRELWKHIVANDGLRYCHSFDHWMNESLWCSASWGYAALSVAEKCSDIPVETRRRIPPKNLMTLRGASPKVRQDPEVQKKAATTKPSEFAGSLDPLQHIEAEEPYKFSPTRSQRAKIDEGINLCLSLGEAHSREEVLEKWAADYVLENIYRTGDTKVVGKVKTRTAVVQ